MIRVLVVLLVALFVANSMLIRSISIQVQELHHLHFNVPKNEVCEELAETEEEYDVCKRLRERYEAPVIVDPRGTRSISEFIEKGEERTKA